MFLSVIIPTRNRAKYLAGALESLTKQTYPTNLFEVIVVDNGSSDNTKEIFTLYAERIQNLRYYYDETPGLHVGRHLGMRMAQSDILVYTDDDIEAFPTWLEAIAESFQNKEVVLVGGKNLPKFETDPPDWILKMWEKKHGQRILGYLSILDLGDEKKEINPLHIFGCNFSIRKHILLEAGGFHPDAMPQELIKYRGDGESHVSKYILRRSYKAIYQPKASVYHLVTSSRMTEEYFYKRAYNQGISDSYTTVRSKNIKQGFIVNNLESLFKRIFYVLKNWVKIGAENDYLLYQAYRAGYKYHVNEIDCDKNLYKWVIKDSYINDLEWE